MIQPEYHPIADPYKDFGFKDASASHMHQHFMEPLFKLCGSLLKPGARVLDIGCGNGFTAGQFYSRGCTVVGIDLSNEGIQHARRAHHGVRFELMPADDRVLQNLACEPFDLVVSTEVVEHLYAPRPYIAGCFAALKPGGRLVLSTPYHGYLKNLVLAVTGHFDIHADPLWDGGHIKLWSRKSLSALLAEAGFTCLQFQGTGRLPFLWMTMVMAGDRPV
jgi:2-polyprenyl-3-methyl-5-hydroxy-6-metoxy-1,4-benzoquinol methylase